MQMCLAGRVTDNLLTRETTPLKSLRPIITNFSGEEQLYCYAKKYASLSIDYCDCRRLKIWRRYPPPSASTPSAPQRRGARKAALPVTLDTARTAGHTCAI
jgi:hypothetical protein